jgi:hypothetical protein
MLWPMNMEFKLQLDLNPDIFELIDSISKISDLVPDHLEEYKRIEMDKISVLMERFINVV